MPHFSLVDPFDIDSHELAGLTPERAFCLGVEWQMFRDLLPVRKASFVEIVSAPNAERLARLCARHGRRAVLRAHDHQWTEIAVGAEVQN